MDNSNTSLKMLPADTFCLPAILAATADCEGFCCCLMMVLLLSVFSKYSVMNFSKAAISSRAVWLISVTAAPEELVMLTSEMLLELLDFLELAVLWLESVLVDPMDRELACLGSVLKAVVMGPEPGGPPRLKVLALLTLEAALARRGWGWCCAFR